MLLATTVGDWAQVAVAATALVGLVAVARQLRVLTNATTMNAYQAFASLMIDVDRIMIENPQLRSCIYGDAPTPTEPDRKQQAEGTAEMFADLADLVFQLRDVMPAETAESWFEHFRGIAEKSEVLGDFLREYWRSYPREMIDRLFPWAVDGSLPDGVETPDDVSDVVQ